jgi:tryptophan synthase beta chain
MKTKILLDEEQIPKTWYNVQADLPSPLDPPLHPVTQKPVGPEDLAAIFPMELIKQEVTTDRYVAIPEEVRDVLRLWRPSPLYRAHRLEKSSRPRQRSTTSGRASARPAATRPTPPSRRPITT